MNRRTMSLALAAAATLVLSACGTDDAPSSAKDTIEGAEKGENAQKESPSAEPSKAAGRPEITLPDDVENVFEGWETGDKTKDAILADVSHRIDATDYAITKADPEAEAVKFYYRGQALAEAQDWILGYKKDGLSITGTVRFHSPGIEVFSASAAGVTYCSDESKGFAKDRDTGKVDKNDPSDNSHILYSARVEKSATGVWQTTELLSERGNAKCVS
ncbi:hypothetical protein ABZ114_10380 [Streptomyces albidoflavus]|uniref:hypothetical protein n=1 Tax=Streptomyces TaxID=1883 RepID=UPI00069E69A1|nr:hypothetical protein [Streptomyces sp. KE1]